MSDLVDLDLQAIEVPAKKVRLPDGDVIEIHPPSLNDFFALGRLMSKFKAFDSTVDVEQPDGSIKKEKAKIDNEQALVMFAELESGLLEIIPALKEHKLSIEHVMSIIQLAYSMSVPAQSKAMEAKGVTADSSQKKSSDR